MRKKPVSGDPAERLADELLTDKCSWLVRSNYYNGEHRLCGAMNRADLLALIRRHYPLPKTEHYPNDPEFIRMAERIQKQPRRRKHAK